MKFSWNEFRCTMLTKLALLCTVLALARSQGDLQRECGQEDLIRCVNPLQMFKNQELSFASSKEDLEILCPKMKEGLECIERYTHRCMSKEQQEHFHRLYEGTTTTIQELCQAGPYQNEFLQHAPCVLKVKSEYELCATTYQHDIKDVSYYGNSNASESDNNKQLQTVCCSFQTYLSCSEDTIRQKCGQETGTFTKGFLDKMASSLIKDHCEKYPPGSVMCMSTQGSAATSGFSSIILLILPALVLFGGALRT